MRSNILPLANIVFIADLLPNLANDLSLAKI